ncbi:phosphotransferase enzyme family protein [Nocardioides sp. Soil805]|uniref:phosphotransferase enzyme family protein n=1 Tax=Nocardioides sp. Soil805 TaxID=1736416 RepID=UPI000B21B9C8|nr:phosphotransferase [Nocardioides sp. Soil805]
MIDVAATLLSHWGMDSVAVRPLEGGMNSDTWLVEHDGTAYVAKHVPATALDDLVAGCEVAASLADAGVVTGRPVPTRDGRIALADQALVLLEHVPGRELDGETDDEQRRIAATLAAVHRAGDPSSEQSDHSDRHFMAEWLDPGLPEVTRHPWLAEAVDAVRAETDRLTLTWSVLHTDPAPEAFVHDDSTGVTGLIDWAGARRGPVLYDVASAVMYLGGPDHGRAFLGTYAERGPLAPEEMQHLDAFRRMREAVQGVYFARRVTARDLTGGVEQADNEKGLDDARRRLAEIGDGRR